MVRKGDLESPKAEVIFGFSEDAHTKASRDLNTHLGPFLFLSFKNPRCLERREGS